MLKPKTVVGLHRMLFRDQTAFIIYEGAVPNLITLFLWKNMQISDITSKTLSRPLHDSHMKQRNAHFCLQ